MLKIKTISSHYLHYDILSRNITVRLSRGNIQSSPEMILNSW